MRLFQGLFLLCISSQLCQQSLSQSTPLTEIDFTDMGSYQHGSQLNYDPGPNHPKKAPIVNSGPAKKDQETQTCPTIDPAGKFYKRLIGSLLTQMQVRERKLNPGDTLTIDIRAELSAADLLELQQFLTTSNEDESPFLKVDSILTSFLKVSAPPQYVTFSEFVKVEFRKLWSQTDVFVSLTVVFFTFIFAQIVAFVRRAAGVWEMFKQVVGAVLIFTVFVLMMQSQGYMLWQSSPVETMSNMFTSVWFRSLEGLIDSISNNISKEFSFLSSFFQPFIKIFVWLIFLVYCIFILMLFSVLVLLLFTVREILSKRIRTWFGVIEPVPEYERQQALRPEVRPQIEERPARERVQIQELLEEDRPQIQERLAQERVQIVRVMARKPVETRNVGVQCRERDLDLEEFIEVDENFAIAED